MSIETSEEICAVFSIFHDGVIFRSSLDDNRLILAVRIKYLAERVNPAFEQFIVQVTGVANITFTTWPNDCRSKPTVIQEFRSIFKPELQILEAKPRDRQIEVICNQAATDFDYSGGELCCGAASIDVSDEAGKNYSVDELSKLCKEYWDNWGRA